MRMPQTCARDSAPESPMRFVRFLPLLRLQRGFAVHLAKSCMRKSERGRQVHPTTDDLDIGARRRRTRLCVPKT